VDTLRTVLLSVTAPVPEQSTFWPVVVSWFVAVWLPDLADPLPEAADRRWVLAGDGTGPGSAADAAADVEAVGPAEVLLELVWHRRTPDDPCLAVTGDRGALEAVLTVALTP
jgi:hypothetical protein